MRAYLVGVAHYDDSGIRDLPFIRDDLTELTTALTGAGYEVTKHPLEQTDPARIDTAIERFIDGAPEGENLLIFLSGHGIHYEGSDFLVPSSADTGSASFAKRCLEINFNDYIDASKCGDVLIVVDACREGIHLKTKSLNAYGWSEREVRQVAGRAISYLYACSAGENARYVSSDIEQSFSVFTRAFSRVMHDSTAPGTLQAASEHIQRIMDQLLADHDLRSQRLRIVGDPGGVTTQVIAVRPTLPEEPIGVHPWVGRVADHYAWGQAAANPELRDATLEMVRGWAKQYSAQLPTASNDPWHDPEFPMRMSDRLQWLLAKALNLAKLARGADHLEPPASLSTAEAAILAAAPFFFMTHWICLAADYSREPQVDAVEYDAFLSRYPRLERKLSGQSLEAADRAAITWWLTHRWLASTPASYSTDAVCRTVRQPSLPVESPGHSLLNEIFSPSRVSAILRTLHGGLSEVIRTDLPNPLLPDRRVAQATGQEQSIREQLIAIMLLVAYRMAIDPAALPSVLVEHLGIADPVSMPTVVQTVQRASWQARGRTRVLDAECAHQAVDLAMVEYVSEFAAELRDVDRLISASDRLAALTDLPEHVSADGVRPITLADGTHAYDYKGFRFRLDDDRVRDLLMGEQLYGHRGLAIRELYQNALDACRYRRARVELLRQQGAELADWQGRIEFRQGVDEAGRPYLLCVDNGVGMSYRELTEVFSNAGARLADLPEFAEEIAEWKHAGIHYYPTSRFGIGVLSYFMLADEITVSTCRLGRSGEPGRRLEVSITGPGTLTKIRDVGQGLNSGTVVTLYLRPGDPELSCVDLLSRVLWLSEFEVEASDGSNSTRWAPGELSPVAFVGSKDPLDSRTQRLASKVLRTKNPAVWWCDTRGGVLANGLWAGESLHGAVVSLDGQLAPELTVDRRQILSYDEAAVGSLLLDQLDVLLKDGAELRTPSWMSELLNKHPRLADELVLRGEQIPETTWLIGNECLDLHGIGYLPRDTATVGRIYQVVKHGPQEYLLSSRGLGEGPASLRSRESSEVCISDWRLRCFANAGLISGIKYVGESIVSGRPTDQILLSEAEGVREIADYQVPFVHLVDLAKKLNWPIATVANRLASLGAQVPVYDWSAGIDPVDANIFLGTAAEENATEMPWIISFRRSAVTVWEVINGAVRSSLSPAQVAARLQDFGYLVPDRPLASRVGPS